MSDQEILDALRAIVSMWPSVGGSNVAGKSATRRMRVSSVTWRQYTAPNLACLQPNRERSCKGSGA